MAELKQKDVKRGKLRKQGEVVQRKVPKMPSFDALIEDTGGCGRWQISQFVVLCLCSVTSAFVIATLGYHLMEPKFKCEGIEDGSPDYLKYCNPSYFCNQVSGDRVVNYQIDW